jgi:CHAT domain-containing protein
MYNLGRVPTWLEERFSGETFIGENADVGELRSRMWNDRIVHFATHGTFPREDEKEWRDPNPYTGSGLLLAHDRRVPSGDMIRTGMRDHLLTPERVLQWDFSGSHVTLHACVSGLASEGIGGDALGLEWALMQAGAESLVATHWNVADEASADFSIHFYQKWIVEGTSRAEAWRESTVMLMNKRYRNAEPEARDWAAFSLSGDWR